MWEQRCNYSKQWGNNVATMCWAKNGRCESSSCNITFIQIALCAQEEVTSHMTGWHKPRFVEPHMPQPRISCRFNSRKSWTPSSAMFVEKVKKKFCHWFYKCQKQGISVSWLEPVNSKKLISKELTSNPIVVFLSFQSNVPAPSTPSCLVLDKRRHYAGSVMTLNLRYLSLQLNILWPR